MKTILFILIFLSKSAEAVSFLTPSQRINSKTSSTRSNKSSEKANIDKISHLDSGTKKLDDKIKKLMEATEANSELLRQRSARPLIYDGSSEIQTSKVFRGTLLNSIRSTNLQSPLLVRADEGEGLPFGTKFECSGVTKHKRVQTVCNRIILPGKTLPVNVTILNDDGSAGLSGKYYDGKEGFIAGTVMMAGISGLVASKQQSVDTALGNITSNSARNQTISAAMSMAQASTDLMKNEIESLEPIVYIEAGKKVLIYFQEDFSFRKRAPLINLEELKKNTSSKMNEENESSHELEETNENT